MNPIAFYLKKRVGGRDYGILLLSINIAPQWVDRLWPTAMAKPATLVRLGARNPKQVMRRALHPQRGWKYRRKTWICGLGNVFHLVLKHHDALLEKDGSIDPEAVVTISIIRAPKGEKAAASGAHLSTNLSPLHSPQPSIPATNF